MTTLLMIFFQRMNETVMFSFYMHSIWKDGANFFHWRKHWCFIRQFHKHIIFIDWIRQNFLYTCFNSPYISTWGKKTFLDRYFSFFIKLNNGVAFFMMLFRNGVF